MATGSAMGDVVAIYGMADGALSELDCGKHMTTSVVYSAISYTILVPGSPLEAVEAIAVSPEAPVVALCEDRLILKYDQRRARHNS